MIRGELAELVEELVAAGTPFVEATVVRAARPTSVRAGDTAIVRHDGTIEGFVGGACAESSVRLHSLRALETGEPSLLRILPSDSPEAADAREGEVTVNNPCLSGGTLEIFLEPRLPAPILRVVGTSPIGRALAALGERVGYAVELELAGESEPRAEDAAVVVASHGHDEERVLTAALREAVPYVGLIASTVRGEAVRESLDLPDELRAQLRTPAGLAIGAETPEEIALSILAEIVAARRSTAVHTRGAGTVAAAARARVGSRCDRPDLRNGGRREPGEYPARARGGALLLLRRGLPRPLRRRARAGCRHPLSRSSPGSSWRPGARAGWASRSSCCATGSATLLDHVLETARARGFDQLVVALGGSVGRGPPPGRPLRRRRGREPRLREPAARRRSPRGWARSTRARRRWC